MSSKTWSEILEEIFGVFRVVHDATPAWLTVPDTGRRLMVDRLYPDLGIVIQFKDGIYRAAPQVHEEILPDLCGKMYVTLIEIPFAEKPTPELLQTIHAALSATSRRLAQASDAEQAKLVLIPQLASAKTVCQEILATVDVPAQRYEFGGGAVVSRLPKLNPWQRFKQRLWISKRRFQGFWELFSQNRLALVGVALIVMFALMALAHPILRATIWQGEMYNPKTGFDFAVFPHPSPPSWLPQPDNPYYQTSFTHILGTDTLGHDVLSVLLAATQPAFLIGITAALSTAIVSTALGALAAFFRGIVDAVIMQIADVFLLLPAPLFMIIFGVVFQDIGSVGYGLIYGLVAGLGGATIVMRSYALTLINKPFIEASRISGGGSLHIVFRHMLPHMMPLAALYMMISVVGAVVADGFISFFGFNRSYLNWGNVIYQAFVQQGVINSKVAWNVLVPASLALSLFAAAFYLVARGLHQVSDPRLRGR